MSCAFFYTRLTFDGFRLSFFQTDVKRKRKRKRAYHVFSSFAAFFASASAFFPAGHANFSAAAHAPSSFSFHRGTACTSEEHSQEDSGGGCCYGFDRFCFAACKCWFDCRWPASSW